MNLEKNTLSALDITRRLQAALEMGDLDICQDLLDLRGEALEVFEASHRASSPEMREAILPLIRELQHEDSGLRLRLSEILQEDGQRLRASLGSASGPGRQAYNTTEPPSCLDRRA